MFLDVASGKLDLARQDVEVHFLANGVSCGNTIAISGGILQVGEGNSMMKCMRRRNASQCAG